MEKITKILEKYPFVQRENLIPVLQDIQNEIGYLTEEAVEEVSKKLDLPASKIYSLATFYSKFRFEPKGKYHLVMCRGTSCHIQGSTHLINKVYEMTGLQTGETTRDGLFSLEVVSCMNSCSFGPIMAVNDSYYTGLNEDKLREIIDFYKESEE
ncbi:MAG: NAD(P)H-dependent oxidoreductase subunit E [Bacteroidota bacterium]